MRIVVQPPWLLRRWTSTGLPAYETVDTTPVRSFAVPPDTDFTARVTFGRTSTVTTGLSALAAPSTNWVRYSVRSCGGSENA